MIIITANVFSDIQLSNISFENDDHHNAVTIELVKPASLTNPIAHSVSGSIPAKKDNSDQHFAQQFRISYSLRHMIKQYALLVGKDNLEILLSVPRESNTIMTNGLIRNMSPYTGGHSPLILACCYKAISFTTTTDKLITDKSAKHLAILAGTFSGYNLSLNVGKQLIHPWDSKHLLHGMFGVLTAFDAVGAGMLNKRHGHICWALYLNPLSLAYKVLEYKKLISTIQHVIDIYLFSNNVIEKSLTVCIVLLNRICIAIYYHNERWTWSFQLITRPTPRTVNMASFGNHTNTIAKPNLLGNS